MKRIVNERLSYCKAESKLFPNFLRSTFFLKKFCPYLDNNNALNKKCSNETNMISQI